MASTSSPPIDLSNTLPASLLASALDTSEAAIAIIALPAHQYVFANAPFRALGAGRGAFHCAAIDSAVAESVQSGRNARIGAFVGEAAFTNDVPAGGVIEGPESMH